MKFAKVLTIASLLCASTAALALPSEAAPFFGANNNASCGTNFFNSGRVGYNPNPYVNSGFNRPFYGNQSFSFNGGFNGGINSQIQRGIASGRLTRGEADRLIRDNNKLAQLRSRLAMNGLSWTERARLNTAIAKLEAQVRISMNNGNRRYW